MTNPFGVGASAAALLDDDTDWSTAPCVNQWMLFDTADHDAVARTEAKEVCSRCPLAAQCLAGARERGERWGIWAGIKFGPPGTILGQSEARATNRCRYNHELTEENTRTRTNADGVFRECRICSRRRNREGYHRNKAKAEDAA